MKKVIQNMGVDKVILFVLLVSLTAPAFAQKNLEGAQKNYTVNVNTSDGYVRITLANKKSNVKPRNNVFYYWYAFGKIMSTMGGYDGHLLNGIYTCFYDNNNLKEKGNFEQGLKVGRWKAWFENGKLKEESNWCKGLRNGLTLTYDEDGNIETQENYKNGIYSGNIIQYQSGQITSNKYYKNGVEYIPKRNHKIKDSLDHQDAPVQDKNVAQGKQKDKKNIFQKIKSLFVKKKDDDGSAEQNATNQTQQ